MGKSPEESNRNDKKFINHDLCEKAAEIGFTKSRGGT